MATGSNGEERISSASLWPTLQILIQTLLISKDALVFLLYPLLWLPPILLVIILSLFVASVASTIVYLAAHVVLVVPLAMFTFTHVTFFLTSYYLPQRFPWLGIVLKSILCFPLAYMGQAVVVFLWMEVSPGPRPIPVVSSLDGINTQEAKTKQIPAPIQIPAFTQTGTPWTPTISYATMPTRQYSIQSPAILASANMFH